MAAQKKSSNKRFFILVGSAFVVLALLMVFALSSLLSKDEAKPRKEPQLITLLPPPPPPPIKEEIQKQEEPKEEIETTEAEQPADKPQDQPPDQPPAEQLGLDADAGLGGDAFGLQARKGGRSLIGGKGQGSMFNWYAGVVSTELQKAANAILQQDGGIPPGEWKKVRFEIMLDVFGKIQKFSIISSSGSSKIDNAVKRALQQKHSFEPPPPGMPKVIKFAVLLQG